MEEVENNEPIQGQVFNQETFEKNIQESNQTVNKELQNINQSTNDLLKFFETEKQEQQIQEQEDLKIEKEQQQQLLEEQKVLEEEQVKEEERQQQFYSDIQTIAENTEAETTTQLLTDVSTLMQVNIIAMGLLIGIVCISLFAKFFKRS